MTRFRYKYHSFTLAHLLLMLQENHAQAQAIDVELACDHCIAKITVLFC